MRRDIRSLISYAVGCMFGRYSLDVPGLGVCVAAGVMRGRGTGVTANTSPIPRTKTALLPICDDEYFADDMVGRFVEFVETVYGAATLEDKPASSSRTRWAAKGQPPERSSATTS